MITSTTSIEDLQNFCKKYFSKHSDLQKKLGDRFRELSKKITNVIIFRDVNTNLFLSIYNN